MGMAWQQDASCWRQKPSSWCTCDIASQSAPVENHMLFVAMRERRSTTRMSLPELNVELKEKVKLMDLPFHVTVRVEFESKQTWEVVSIDKHVRSFHLGIVSLLGRQLKCMAVNDFKKNAEG